VLHPPRRDRRFLTSPSPPSVNPTYGTGVPTERGSLPKVIGQHAAVTNPGTTDVVVDFVLSGVQGARCNSGADDPKNGKFVAVKVSAKTATDAQNLLPRVVFGAGWEFVSRDGESVVASTVQAASCDYDPPSELKPNRSYNFDVVLDVPQSTAGGVVVFDPVRNGGWEWPIP